MKDKLNNIRLLISEINCDYRDMDINQKFDFLVNNKEILNFINFNREQYSRKDIFFRNNIKFTQDENDFIDNLFLESKMFPDDKYPTIYLSGLLEEVRNNSDKFQNNKNTILKIIKVMLQNDIDKIYFE